MSERLASSPQLWRLNQAGLLRISEPGEPITAPTAFALVADLVHKDSGAGRAVVLDRSCGSQLSEDT